MARVVSYSVRDNASCLDSCRFKVDKNIVCVLEVVGYPVISQQRISKAKYLPNIRRISHCFRVSNHSCVEYYFAYDRRRMKGTKRITVKNFTVFKHKLERLRSGFRNENPQPLSLEFYLSLDLSLRNLF